MLSDYGNPGYWDERYAYSSADDSYDWYQDYSTLKQHLKPFLFVDSEILIPGCGNSSLACDLYNDGFKNITNIDTSKVVISQMQEKYSEFEEMEFAVINALNMESIPRDCFDVIIDKGLLDCQLCSLKNLQNVDLLTKEVFRVLKSNGVYIIISHSSPENRLGYLQRSLNWKITFQKLPKFQIASKGNMNNDNHHYMYICRKI